MEPLLALQRERTFTKGDYVLTRGDGVPERNLHLHRLTGVLQTLELTHVQPTHFHLLITITSRFGILRIAHSIRSNSK